MSDDLLDAMVVAHYGGAPEDALCDLGVDGMDYELKAMARVLAELRKRGALVPDGWKVMPVEPTEEMEHVGGACVDHPSVYMSGPSRRGVRLAKQVYAAMLAAAPAPTTGEG